VRDCTCDWSAEDEAERFLKDSESTIVRNEMVPSCSQMVVEVEVEVLL
jgi:hypothetical protein